MNMMSPVTGNTPPLAAVTGIAPVRPIPDAAAFAQGDPGQERPGDDRDRGDGTTLRYKFDWLVQRQVTAGTIDPDEAAEMIRLFDDTIGGTDADRPDPVSDSAPARPQPADGKTTPPTGRDAAAALLDRMRERFGVDGPYDDNGGQSASTPTGMIVDDRV